MALQACWGRVNIDAKLLVVVLLKGLTLAIILGLDNFLVGRNSLPHDFGKYL